MNRKNRDGEVSVRKLLSVVMAVVLVCSLLIAFVPSAGAVTITKFEVTPMNSRADAVSAYTIQVNTTNFTSLNITIPARFKAKKPSAGDLIAEVDLWWDEPSPGTYYGYINFTANATDPSNKVDVYADIGGATATLRGMDVNYGEGETTSIKSPFGSNQERANLSLPTGTASGSLRIHGLPDNITNVTVSIGEFVKNPAIAGDYEFTADGVRKTIGITTPPTPPPAPRGGGGGAAAPPGPPAGVTTISTTPTGEVKSTVTATSTDAKAAAKIPAKTIAKDATGNPLTKITVMPPSVLPAAPPATVSYVGYAYDFGPTGATFSKPVEISITFDPADFEGKTPVIYTYEEVAGEWKALDTTVVDNKAIAKVTHFSTFVLFAERPKPTPTPTPTPTPSPSPVVSPTPTPSPSPSPTPPGFETVFAIAGLLAVAYLVLRRKKS